MGVLATVVHFLGVFYHFCHEDGKNHDNCDLEEAWLGWLLEPNRTYHAQKLAHSKAPKKLILTFYDDTLVGQRPRCRAPSRSKFHLHTIQRNTREVQV